MQGAQGSELTRDAWDSLVKRLKGFIHNAGIERYFLVEAEGALGLNPLFADFQHLVSIPIETARAFPVRAALASPYREKLIMHFSAYSARIGVDRMGEEDAEALTAFLAEPYHGPARV